jgi:hypothetical protein
MFLPSGLGPPGSSNSSADFKQTRVALITAAWGFGAAPLGFAAQLLLADEGECGAELFILHDRGLRDLTNFIEGPIC